MMVLNTLPCLKAGKGYGAMTPAGISLHSNFLKCG